DRRLLDRPGPMKRSHSIILLAIALLLVLFFLTRQHGEERATGPSAASAQRSETNTTGRQPSSSSRLPSLYVAPARSQSNAGEMSFSGRVLSRASGAGIADAELTFSET